MADFEMKTTTAPYQFWRTGPGEFVDSSLRLFTLLLLLLLLLFARSPLLAQQGASSAPELEWFLEAADRDDEVAAAALARIAAQWDNSYASMIVDLVKVVQKRDDGYRILERLTGFLGIQTGQAFGLDLKGWRRWLVSLPYEPHPHYLRFKSFVYQAVDPKMGQFFPPDVNSRIRLDEIEWGGVRVNGIPPLDMPEYIPASEAGYLKDSNLVFGVSLNGESRAYPKRILAWHELARDRLGGVEFTFVYCTLCGSAIPYQSEVGGRVYKFGTSGLLFRSNKLMFDEQTKSLWSSIEGSPVVGPLADTDLQLQIVPVVTTGWKEWRQAHPETTVLSLNTGHQRDYSEGAAYRDYFATQELMFSVQKEDDRLQHKDEVLALLLSSSTDERRQTLAISTRLLKKNPVFHFNGYGRELVVLTSPRGASRVYEAGAVRFTRLNKNRIRDAQRRSWRVTEEALLLEEDGRERLDRVPASQAFWFGWFARFPDTRLIHTPPQAR